jgi:hypothetical protein
LKKLPGRLEMAAGDAQRAGQVAQFSYPGNSTVSPSVVWVNFNLPVKAEQLDAPDLVHVRIAGFGERRMTNFPSSGQPSAIA